VNDLISQRGGEHNSEPLKKVNRQLAISEERDISDMEQGGDSTSNKRNASSFSHSHKDRGGLIDLSFDVEFNLVVWI